MAIKNKLLTNPVTGQEILFLQTAKDTSGELLEMETTYSAHSTEPIAHYHPYQSEDFKVLAGELTVRINGVTRKLQAQDILSIPPNTLHAMWNVGDQPAKVNWRVRPAMQTEYLLETTFGLAADGKVNKKGMPSVLQMALSINKYNQVFRLSKPSFVLQRVLFTILSPFGWLKGLKASYEKYID